MSEEILAATIDAFNAVTEPRFFRTERGYHGRFYCALQAALDARRLLKDGLILEMEYQKSARHELGQRPDIILHIPAEDSGSLVTENNLAVFALKWRASASEALDDFGKLDEMCDALRYRLAVFINVACERHHKDRYSGPFGDRLHAFAVSLADGSVKIVSSRQERA